MSFVVTKVLLSMRFFNSLKTICSHALLRSGSRCKMALKDCGLGRYLSMGSSRVEIRWLRTRSLVTYLVQVMKSYNLTNP